MESVNNSVENIQVALVVEMVNASRSLRCYTKPSSGSLIQFSGFKEDANDAGDCGGITVFSFLNVSAFGNIQILLKNLVVMIT